MFVRRIRTTNDWELIKNVNDNGQLGARAVIKSFVETEKSPMKTRSLLQYWRNHALDISNLGLTVKNV